MLTKNMEQLTVQPWTDEVCICNYTVWFLVLKFKLSHGTSDELVTSTLCQHTYIKMYVKIPNSIVSIELDQPILDVNKKHGTAYRSTMDWWGVYVNSTVKRWLPLVLGILVDQGRQHLLDHPTHEIHSIHEHENSRCNLCLTSTK